MIDGPDGAEGKDVRDYKPAAGYAAVSVAMVVTQ